MKVYITKYALTLGILEKEAEECGNKNMVRVGMDYFHNEGSDWHLTMESARTRAEEMRVRKIASLKKAIEKLEKLAW